MTSLAPRPARLSPPFARGLSFAQSLLFARVWSYARGLSYVRRACVLAAVAVVSRRLGRALSEG